MVFLHFFPFRLGPQAEVRNAFTKWHVAYHGTAVGNVRNILDCGDLMLPGMYTLIAYVSCRYRSQSLVLLHHVSTQLGRYIILVLEANSDQFQILRSYILLYTQAACSCVLLANMKIRRLFVEVYKACLLGFIYKESNKFTKNLSI